MISTKKLQHCIVVLSICFTNIIFAQKIKPTDSGYVKTNGATIFYQIYGDGEPLLLLHHFQSTGTDSWSPFIAEFSESFKLVIPDLRGHGQSTEPNPDLPYAIEPAADDMITLLDSLKLKNVKSIGSSVGGAILYSAALKRPELFSDMVTIGGIVFRPQVFRQWIKNHPDDQVTPELIKLHGAEKAATLISQFNQAADFYGDHELTPDLLAKITTRTLIINSDKDPLVPVEHAWHIYQSVPNGHLWVVPHLSHLPHLYPEIQDEFRKRVLDFLKAR